MIIIQNTDVWNTYVVLLWESQCWFTENNALERKFLDILKREQYLQEIHIAKVRADCQTWVSCDLINAFAKILQNPDLIGKCYFSILSSGITLPKCRLLSILEAWVTCNVNRKFLVDFIPEQSPHSDRYSYKHIHMPL